MKPLQRLTGFAKLLAQTSHHSPSEAVSYVFATQGYACPLQSLLTRVTGPIQQTDGCLINQQASAFHSRPTRVLSVPSPAAEAFTSRNAADLPGTRHPQLVCTVHSESPAQLLLFELHR